MDEHFEYRELRLFDDAEEVEIETVQSDTHALHRAAVWVVVVGSDVYLRSANGERAHWYQHLTANPVGVIYAEDQRIPIGAAPVSDAQIQQQVSEAYLRKYAQYPHDAMWIAGPEVLPTTLRLEPRFHSLPS